MFSVVTISFNSGQRLRRCLDSVLRQTFRDFEYIVVDGGSTDTSVDTLRNLDDRLDYFVSEPDGGIYRALNRGLSLTRGRFIVVIHADDYLTLDALEQAASVIAATGCDMALGDSIYIDGEGKPVAFKPARDYGSEATLRGIPGPHEAAFIAATTYERIGPYDCSYKIAADFKLLRNAVLNGATCAQIGRVVNYKELGGESFDKDREQAENARLLDEIYPGLPAGAAKQLYALKNFVNPTPAQLNEVAALLRDGGGLPATLLRDVALALLSRARGDGPGTSTASSWDRWLRHAGARTPGRRRIVLTLFKLKSIAGGAERVLTDLANYLASKGDEVWVVCTDGRSGLPFYDLHSGVRFLDLNEMPHNTHFLQPIQDLQKELHDIVAAADPLLLRIAAAPLALRGSFRSWSTFEDELMKTVSVEHARGEVERSVAAWARRFAGNVARWRSFLKATKPDLVLPFMISNIQQLFVAGRGTGTRMLPSNHNNSIRDYYLQDDWDATPIDRLLRFEAVRSAVRTHWLLDEYVEQLPPACRSNAEVIGNAIHPASMQHDETQAMPTVLGVGRLTEVKNFGLLVRAFALIANRHPKWTVAIFGDGPQRDAIQDLIDRAGLGGRVRLMGITNQIELEYVRSGIFVSTSTVEGFPLTLCEAMAHGMPVIGRNACSGVNALVTDGTDGVLIGPGDAEQEAQGLATAIETLINDPYERRRMGKAARRRMEAFAPDIVFSRWSEAVDRALQVAR